MIDALKYLSSPNIVGMYPFPFGAPQVWLFPDGTKSTTKPKDGQTCSNTDPMTGNFIEWVWDDVKQQWFVKNPLNPIYTYKVVYNPKIEFHDVKITIGDLPEVKCDCGSHAVGSPRHSTWCKKYDPKQ